MSEYSIKVTRGKLIELLQQAGELPDDLSELTVKIDDGSHHRIFRLQTSNWTLVTIYAYPNEEKTKTR